MWVQWGKMVGKDKNILGQLANIGRSKLEANRCQFFNKMLGHFGSKEALLSAHFQERLVIFFLI